MGVLNREEFFDRLHKWIGTDTSEESISFLEDISDTYNELEKRGMENGEDWRRKYDELDKAWRERYRHRFFSGGDYGIPSSENGSESNVDRKGEKITIEDVFEEG